jgi:hypothetical protein
MGRPLLTADAPTSDNDHSLKGFQDRQGNERPLNSSPATRALDARCAGSPTTLTAAGCPLCDDAGMFLDAEGFPVELLNDDNHDGHEVECRHSMPANLAEIQRIENDSVGYWQIACTGWPHIDSNYPHLAELPADE